MVEKGLLQEVSRGRSTGKLGRAEQFIVFQTLKLIRCKIRINRGNSMGVSQMVSKKIFHLIMKLERKKRTWNY